MHYITINHITGQRNSLRTFEEAIHTITPKQCSIIKITDKGNILAQWYPNELTEEKIKQFNKLN